MARSKSVNSRRRRQADEQDELSKPTPSLQEEVEAGGMARIFQPGEVLSQEEIQERIAQMGVVRHADDEFFRLLKARVFKRHEGKYIVRG